jgi:hypothetical protein
LKAIREVSALSLEAPIDQRACLSPLDSSAYRPPIRCSTSATVSPVDDDQGKPLDARIGILIQANSHSIQ